MEIDGSQMNTDQTNQTGSSASELVKVINNLSLIGALLSVLSSEDKIILASAYIKLIAGFLSVGAALLESKEQEISPGVTTPLNQLKTIGSTIMLVGSLILIYVLQQETALRKAGIGPPSAPISPIISPAFI